MGTSTNSKVFVSPGVYTSEVDLSFVSQSVGVTTLGIVGETLKGPAFEPIFIKNFDEFTTFFGGTSPEKFVNTQIPKYEASYIAKAYLQQSNQLFVTRVLGLSGYDAGPSWSIVAKGNVNPDTIDLKCIDTEVVDCETVCIEYQEFDYSLPFTGCNTDINSIIFDTTSLNSIIKNKLNDTYQEFNGGSSSISLDLKSQIFNVLKTPSSSGETVNFFGAVPSATTQSFSGYSASTNVFGVENINQSLINFKDSKNDTWYYSLFDNNGNASYSGSSFFSEITSINEISSTSNCSTFYDFGVYILGDLLSSSVTINTSGGFVPVIESLEIAGDLTDDLSAGDLIRFTYDNSVETNNPTIVEILSIDFSDGITTIVPNFAGFIPVATASTNESLWIVSPKYNASINYNTNSIKVCLPEGVTESELTTVIPVWSACSTDVKIGSVVQYNGTTVNNFNSNTNKCLTYTLTSQDGADVQEWSVCLKLYNPCVDCNADNSGSGNPGVVKTCYSGVVEGTIYVYSGTAYTEFDDLVIATLRSRGLNADGSGATFQVDNLNNVSIDCTSAEFVNVLKNPFAKFGLNVTTIDNQNLSFQTSFSSSDSNYLSKLFGSSNFGKDRKTLPLFVEEIYPMLLQYGYRKGYIRGLSCDVLPLPGARQGVDASSIGFYLEQYQTPKSPWVVSEFRGGKVFNLFRFTTISDGNGANTEVKISIANISFNNGTFDVLVRDFFDSDENPVIIEKFTNCGMNPNENNYIANKIGTVDGEYQLNSKYIMIEVNEEAPIDSLPCGFEGYVLREYSNLKSPFPIYKTKYDYPGEVIFNPPFGSVSGIDNIVRSGGDNVRRTYLGFSDSVGIDSRLLEYKGKRLPLNLACDTTGDEWNYKTKGFHMDINASAITVSDSYSTSGQSAFFVGSDSFSSEPTNESSPYYRLYSRKFTLAVAGGFDGWDIYREYRTNQDKFKLGRSGYLKGASPDCSTRYPNATGWGAFKQITIGNNSNDWANTDYYAYLLGYRTFENPEAVNINVFVTPGVDYVNHSDLVGEVIDMIEYDRADSVYITTTPDYNMYVPTAGDTVNLIYPQEAVDNLEDKNIDSNYTATYYPWVLTKDTVNNTQLYIPATAEVTKNLALTDNIAFPWFAAAGYTRGIVNSVKARKKLTQEERDVLYKGRINPIATFSDVGTVIWGNKTLQIRESALDRLNVRRLLLQARKLISAVSVRLLFDQNDDKVRQDFLNAVNPILDGIRRDRGLYDFRVVVTSDTSDLDRNQMTGKIYIKPTKSLEFIDITFYITPAGASFENI